jgi:hypothetical protein
MTTLTKVFRKLPSHRDVWCWRVARRGPLTPKPSSKRYSPRDTSILWSCSTCKPTHPRSTHSTKLVLKVHHRQLLQQCRRHRLSTPLRAVPQRLQTPEIFHNSDQHISNNYVRRAGCHDTPLCVDVGLVAPGRARWPTILFGGVSIDSFLVTATSKLCMQSLMPHALQ